MKVALYDVDSTIPNLAIMKLSAYHKERGDNVEPYLPVMGVEAFDKVYASTIFSDSDKTFIDPRMDVGGSATMFVQADPLLASRETPAPF